MKCPKCNTENEGWALYCVSCKNSFREPIEQKLPPPVQNMPEEPRQRREPVLAGILSFLYMGLGQAYNGQRYKGYMFFAAIPASVIFYFILHSIFHEPIPKKGEEPSFASPSYIIITICYFCIWLFNVYEAYQSAKRINDGEIMVEATPGRSCLTFIITIVLWFIGIFAAFFLFIGSFISCVHMIK